MPFNLAYNRQTMNGMPIILSCYGAAVDNLLLLTGCDFGFFFPVFFPGIIFVLFFILFLHICNLLCMNILPNSARFIQRKS